MISTHFTVILVPWGALGDPWGALGDRAVLRSLQNRFFTRLGSLFETLGASFGKPFQSLWPPGGPRNRRKRRIGECLVANPIFHGICFSFQVPWIPKSKHSVWERSSKPHFRPRQQKHDFEIIWDWFLTNFLVISRTPESQERHKSDQERPRKPKKHRAGKTWQKESRRIPQKETRRQRGVTSGAVVKRHILRKAWLIPRQSATPAR